MIGYAERNVFSRMAAGALKIADALVEGVGVGWGDALRCHELARAVQICLREAGYPRARIVDGRMGSIDHSWIVLPGCELQAGSDSAPILDVYAPGRLPQVQLIDASWVISADYVVGSERLDVRRDIVRQLVQEMTSSTPPGSQVIQAVDLASRYAIPEMKDVLINLSNRPDLLREILAAADELRQRFGRETHLSLNAPDGERLVIVVDAPLEITEAHDRMMRFLREWWWIRVSVEDRITARLRRKDPHAEDRVSCT
jgi:hypothetical protein